MTAHHAELLGDPRLDRAVPAENKRPGQRRRHVVIAMTVVIVVFLAWAVLSVATAPVASAQSPEPPPWIGGRVEMPEHGFAVTLPDDWVTFDLEVEGEGQVEAASGVLDPIVWPVDSVQTAWAASMSQGVQLLSAHTTSTDHCLFTAVPVSVSGMTAEDLAGDMFERYVDDPVGYDVEPPQSIDLPAGPAYFISISGWLPGVGTWWASTYMLDMDEGAFFTVCTTYDHPENDWLSIAETIEYLPAEE